MYNQVGTENPTHIQGSSLGFKPRSQEVRARERNHSQRPRKPSSWVSKAEELDRALYWVKPQISARDLLHALSAFSTQDLGLRSVQTSLVRASQHCRLSYQLAVVSFHHFFLLKVPQCLQKTQLWFDLLLVLSYTQRPKTGRVWQTADSFQLDENYNIAQ